MYYYLILFCIIVTFAWLDSIAVQRNVRDTLFFIAIVLLALTAGLRFETGVDWHTYTKLFRETPAFDQITDPAARKKILVLSDSGYTLLMSVVKALGGNIQVIFFFMAMATSFFLWQALKKYTAYPMVGLMIYYSLIFFVLDMSGMRQAFSVAVFLYAAQYIISRQFLKYCLFITLAALIHWTAFLLIPMYFLLHRRISVVFVLIVSVVSSAIFFLNISWMDSIVIYVLPYISDEKILEKISVYTATKIFTAKWEMNNNNLIMMGTQLLIFFLLLWKYNALQARSKYFVLFFNMYVFQLVLFFIFFEFPEIGFRLRFYFIIATVVLLPLFIDLFVGRWQKTFAFSCLAFYALLIGRAYIFEMESVIAYSPYQNYVVYKILDKEGTGRERIYIHFKRYNVE